MTFCQLSATFVPSVSLAAAVTMSIPDVAAMNAGVQPM